MGGCKAHGRGGGADKTAWKTFGWLGLAVALLSTLLGYLWFQIPPEYR
ncbi:MAG: hypothetical protein U9R68_10635 [Planctomycetota bacterium]|nr:hypothetical protein [Planctomycetota bacterium]